MHRELCNLSKIPYLLRRKDRKSDLMPERVIGTAGKEEGLWRHSEACLDHNNFDAVGPWGSISPHL